MNVKHLHIPKRHVVLWVMVMVLTGPMLPLASSIKHWANASRFEMPDRWASVRAFAVIFMLPYAAIALLLLLPPLAEQRSLVVLWIQQHFFFKTSLLWGSFLFLWGSTQPLVFWLTLLLQELAPENPLHSTRVALPGEIPAPQSGAMQPVAVTPAPVPPSVQQKPKRRRTTSTKKKEKPQLPTVKLQPPEEPAEQATTSAAGRSLWDQTDWSNVPDNDPIKQLALEEDRQRRSKQIRFVEPPVEAPLAPQPEPQEPPAQAPAEPPEQKKRIDWSKVDE